MAKLIHISRERLEEGRIKQEKLLAEDKFWQEELRLINQFEAEEKARRDAEYAAQQEALK